MWKAKLEKERRLLFICLCKSNFVSRGSGRALFADERKGLFSMPRLKCVAGFMEPAVKRHDLDQVLAVGLLL